VAATSGNGIGYIFGTSDVGRAGTYLFTEWASTFTTSEAFNKQVDAATYVHEELAQTRSCSLGRQSLRENSGHDRVIKRDH
jgi:hypothetical protein